MKTLVILGTARTDSNTLKALEELCPFADYEVVELHKLRIESYSYGGSAEDDFPYVARKMMEADRIVFATPVYWYAMSGTMKVFFDRLTDLLSVYKPIGKSLTGKRVFLVATGTEEELPEGLEVPFRRTAEYFDMVFEKTFYKMVK